MAEFVYTLRSGIDVTVEYEIVSDGDALDVRLGAVTPLGMPQCLAAVDDDELEDIEVAAHSDAWGEPQYVGSDS